MTVYTPALRIDNVASQTDQTAPFPSRFSRTGAMANADPNFIGTITASFACIIIRPRPVKAAASTFRPQVLT